MTFSVVQDEYNPQCLNANKNLCYHPTSSLSHESKVFALDPPIAERRTRVLRRRNDIQKGDCMLKHSFLGFSLITIFSVASLGLAQSKQLCLDFNTSTFSFLNKFDKPPKLLGKVFNIDIFSAIHNNQISFGEGALEIATYNPAFNAQTVRLGNISLKFNLKKQKITNGSFDLSDGARDFELGFNGKTILIADILLAKPSVLNGVNYYFVVVSSQPGMKIGKVFFTSTKPIAEISIGGVEVNIDNLCFNVL
jgi:hypothetical protein